MPGVVENDRERNSESLSAPDVTIIDPESKYRSLVERLPAIVYIEDTEEESSRLLYVSPALRTILGFEPHEWEACSGWSEQLHPEDRERVLEEAAAVAASGEPWLSEYRMFARDGRLIWIRDEATLVRDEAGTPQFWQGVMQDVTERKQAEHQLRETEARYRTLVEQTPAVTYIASADEEARTLYISPQVETMLGYPTEAWMTGIDDWIRLVHPDDRQRYLEEDARADDKHSLSIEYRVITPDECEVWIHEEAVLVRDSDGRPMYWQGVMIDITAQKRASELERALEVERASLQRLRAVDEMKNTFLNAVSHDLRTPLAAILGLALTLDRDDIQLGPKETRDLNRRIAANARKLDRLVTDLLDLDRLSRGILELTRRRTDLGALVRRVAEESDVLAERPVEIQADDVIVSVDAAKVERIVENLVANAVRHTPPEAQVWIKVRGERRGALIAVEDDGPGVPAEIREAIFEPFRQANDPQAASPGVGIGLSLVARFAELHGGRAWVTDRPGGGASFRVFLP